MTPTMINALLEVEKAAKEYEDIQTAAWHRLEKALRNVDAVREGEALNPPDEDEDCYKCKGLGHHGPCDQHSRERGSCDL